LCNSQKRKVFASRSKRKVSVIKAAKMKIIKENLFFQKKKSASGCFIITESGDGREEMKKVSNVSASREKEEKN
jgi:hypothetical protein